VGQAALHLRRMLRIFKVDTTPEIPRSKLQLRLFLRATPGLAVTYIMAALMFNLFGIHTRILHFESQYFMCLLAEIVKHHAGISLKSRFCSTMDRRATRVRHKSPIFDKMSRARHRSDAGGFWGFEPRILNMLSLH
jgi:hypothetical protein